MEPLVHGLAGRVRILEIIVRHVCQHQLPIDLGGCGHVVDVRLLEVELFSEPILDGLPVKGLFLQLALHEVFEVGGVDGRHDLGIFVSIILLVFVAHNVREALLLGEEVGMHSM